MTCESQARRVHALATLLVSGTVASFTPLVFATTGGMGGEAVTCYRRLAELLSKRKALSYSSTLAWHRCTLSFSLIRSATMCIRGSRSISLRSSDASPELGLTNGPRDISRCPFQFCPAHLPSVLGVVGKGMTSNPGKKKRPLSY